MSGLHVAASRGSDWAAHILLKTGADPHAPARSCGLSALHLALSSQGETNFLPRAWLKANALAAHANQSEDHAGAPGRGRRPAPPSLSPASPHARSASTGTRVRAYGASRWFAIRVCCGRRTARWRAVENDHAPALGQA